MEKSGRLLHRSRGRRRTHRMKQHGIKTCGGDKYFLRRGQTVVERVFLPTVQTLGGHRFPQGWKTLQGPSNKALRKQSFRQNFPILFKETDLK